MKFPSGTLKRFLGNFREVHVECSNAGSGHYLAFFLAAAFLAAAAAASAAVGIPHSPVDIVFLLSY